MSRLERFFAGLIKRRWWVIAAYAILLVPATYFSIRVQQDNSLDRLMIPSDPAYVTAQDFAKSFGSGEYVVLLCEAPDPFAPDVLRKLDDLEQRIAGLAHVDANSALTIFRRGRGDMFQATPEQSQEFRKFATGTDLFKKQGLVGDKFLAIALILQIEGTKDRGDVLRNLNDLLKPFEDSPAPLSAIRKVGQPYLNAYLDHDTRTAGMKYFPLFTIFVILLNILLYRSFRSLIAFMIALLVSADFTVAYVGMTGGTFTIVSALVPMTVLITCAATLVYLHSRYVECPPDRTADEHLVYSMANKFLPCAASIFATAVGFAALAVSDIRPIRELGIWVAVGLVFTLIICFTLFPALQKALRTPTQQERRVAGTWYTRFTDFLPGFSYRWRYPLVISSLLLCAAGLVALFGIPGMIDPMRIEIRTLEYINHESSLYQDTKRLEELSSGLSLTEVWVRGEKYGVASDPETIRGLDDFQKMIEKEKVAGSELSAMGLPTILRLMRYIQGEGDKLPESEDELEAVSSNLESLIGREPMLQRFVNSDLTQTHFVVITKTIDHEQYESLQKMLTERWQEAVKRHPALAQFKMVTTGLAPLQAKISFSLVPTLTESFGLSVVIIFVAFLVVFRNGPARLMAMIPSLFAILVMFLVMRLTGTTLNVATILIASTVLGTSENDQIHFFYHFQEKRKDGTVDESLRHTLRIAGRAIWFATLINAGGFLAFGLADLPPIRQFGILTALALVLSMIADFTALPAALWMVFRDKPDALKAADPAAAPPSGTSPLPATVPADPPGDQPR